MSISLDVRYSKQERDTGVFAYLLRVEVSHATDMTDKIFVFQRNVMSLDAEANRLSDQFMSIADPVDLEEFPEDAPDLDNQMPYYRKNSVDLVFRSMVELEETKALIEADIRTLVNSMKASQTVVTMEEATYD